MHTVVCVSCVHAQRTSRPIRPLIRGASLTVQLSPPSILLISQPMQCCPLVIEKQELSYRKHIARQLHKNTNNIIP